MSLVGQNTKAHYSSFLVHHKSQLRRINNPQIALSESFLLAQLKRRPFVFKSPRNFSRWPAITQHMQFLTEHTQKSVHTHTPHPENRKGHLEECKKLAVGLMGKFIKPGYSMVGSYSDHGGSVKNVNSLFPGT